MTTPTSYTPKGSMCMSCQHAQRDCSALPFAFMPVITRHGDVAVVRCTEHAKAAALEALLI
jgi:hypothetical protein